MAMKTSSAKFKDRVDEGIHNDFMRLAVSSAQERLHGRRLTAVQTSSNKNKLCLIVNLNNSDSLPANPTAAQAMAID